MLSLAGITPPARMQGRSLIPLIQNQQPAGWRTEFFYEHNFLPQRIPPSEGVRTERFAYIRWLGEHPLLEELFDVQADTLESHNLAGDPKYAETLAQLRARWKSYTNELK